jgi:23S rRNA (cytidine2498-2'-O)-methyltransferase
LKMRGADVRRREFRDVNWLAADLNVAPGYTLDAVEAVVTHPGTTIRGLVLTLKLPDWNLADQLPDYLARVRGWGYRDVRARQLAFSGREVSVFALRNRSVRRLARHGKRRLTTRIDAPHSTPPAPHTS